MEPRHECPTSDGPIATAFSITVSTPRKAPARTEPNKEKSTRANLITRHLPASRHDGRGEEAYDEPSHSKKKSLRLLIEQAER